jgi:sugar phosphate isomerase/epimerase
MRLGGPVFTKYSSPREWVTAVKSSGYRAAYCPVDYHTDEKTIKAYEIAAAENDIVIAEVGAWSNPLSPHKEEQGKALEHCKKSLWLAEKIGARCCVNIAGSLGKKWDGPSPLDLSSAAFDQIVASVQEIIDSVKPERTFYTLETMQWMYPDSTDTYVALIKAINRPGFAAHFDPVNLISSPGRYFNTTQIISEFVAKLGPRIRSCHAKDIILGTNATVHLDEIRPGKGALDYRTYLTELDRLDRETPLMLEHLQTEEEYLLAAGYIRSVAETAGITL